MNNLEIANFYLNNLRPNAKLFESNDEGYVENMEIISESLVHFIVIEGNKYFLYRFEHDPGTYWQPPDTVEVSEHESMRAVLSALFHAELDLDLNSVSEVLQDYLDQVEDNKLAIMEASMD